ADAQNAKIWPACNMIDLEPAAAHVGSARVIQPLCALGRVERQAFARREAAIRHLAVSAWPRAGSQAPGWACLRSATPRHRRSHVYGRLLQPGSGASRSMAWAICAVEGGGGKGARRCAGTRRVPAL